MRQVHPTESASDGRPIEQSHYIKKSDQLDRYVECGQCGYPVNLKNRSTGPFLGAIGNPSISAVSGTPPGPGIAFTDTVGDPVDTRSGCPFCNSMNPQAKGRTTDPFSYNTRNVENL